MDKVHPSDVCHRVLESQSKLLETWKSFNYSECEIDRRQKRFVKHIAEMCSDMEKTEVENLEETRKSIDLKRFEIDELIADLSLESNQISPERMSNLSLADQLQTLDKKSAELKAQRKVLLDKYQTLENEFGSLCEEMHEDASEFIPATGTGSSVQKRIDAMEQKIEDLLKMKGNRIAQIEHLRNNILQNLKLLSKDAPENQVRLIYHKYSPSSEYISNLKILDKKYAKEVESGRQQISVVYKEIEGLWKLLETGKERMSEVTAVYRDYRSKTCNLMTILARLNAELKHCLEEKAEQIQFVLARFGTELESLWELCFWDQSKREEFEAGLKDLSGDDKVSAHDREIMFLRKHFESNLDIFNSVRKYISAWEEWKALQSSDQSSPSRLANRGGRLLLEEKKRNTISKKIRDVENTINALVEPHSMHGDAVIMIFGKPVKLWLAQYKASQTKRELAMNTSVAVKRKHNFDTSNSVSNSSIGLQRSTSYKSFAKGVSEVNNTQFLKRFPSANAVGPVRPLLRGKPVAAIHARKLNRRKSGRHSISTPERIRNEQSCSTLVCEEPIPFPVRKLDLESTDFDFNKTTGNEDGKGVFVFGPRHTSTPLVFPDPNSAKVPV